MLPRHLLALVVGFLLQAGASAGREQTFISEELQRSIGAQSVLEYQPVKDAACEQFPKGPIETTSCDFETVESVSDDLYAQLRDLVQTPFFKYFRADLYRDCPFWQENGLCMNRECGITTVDESEIPEAWRAKALSKVEVSPKQELHQLPGCYYRDSDFCFLDDMSEGDYIDLSVNPERFTGYTGPSAHRVWKSIYEENCFGISQFDTLNALPEDSKTCLEQRVYYKIISGMHASISTHICHDDFNQTTGKWGPNLQCFINRIASYPERLEYMYFNAVLLLRAVARIGPYLSAYDYCGTGTHEGDQYTLEKLNNVISIAQNVGRFDETTLFRGPNAQVLKEEFKQHFRNVSRIMDCVGCDKCRLWGKVQTSGVGTALKILFELDQSALDPKINHNLLTRSEVVALMNTLHRFTESLVAVNDFRKMWAREAHSQRDRLLDGMGDSENPSQPRRSPPAGQESKYYFVEDLQRWVRACKEGTVFCVKGLLTDLQNAVEAVTRIFQVSRKDRAPHVEF
ncbi:hypothetical protein PHLGIDRAFT_129668 [Phlebiopsis gigantea 11061_1 CR5-6]|uniref:Endoplasmic oxidoreductin-1 n=1 Tax=Phlebiopsis gigantea (strain 11061_1 CR5-6) TaxID=745531 RepID=A0A0C3S6N0_PHLG1|nr:hypothetical protein PHLGIDRAFT_129668 [Phlebiopsis gigantea 11061_1 CR5-6]